MVKKMPKNTHQNDDQSDDQCEVKRTKRKSQVLSSYDEDEIKKKMPQTEEGQFWRRKYNEQLAINNSLKSQLESSKTPDQKKLEKDRIECSEKKLEAEILIQTFLSLIKAQNSKNKACIEKNKQILIDNLSVYINFSHEQLFNLVGSLLASNINFMEEQYKTSKMLVTKSELYEKLRIELNETELKLAQNEALLNAYNQISLDGLAPQMSTTIPEITQPVSHPFRDSYSNHNMWCRSDSHLTQNNNNNNQGSFSDEHKSEDEVKIYYPGRS